jgi:hypothetical protein
MKQLGGGDMAFQKKLSLEELRKREFDRKLERNMRAIEDVISKKFQSNSHFKETHQRHSHQLTFGGLSINN